MIRKIAAALCIFLAPSLAMASWSPTLDLSAAPKAGMARELNDGNWLYTASWAPFVLTHSSGFEAHAGLLQGWRADKGDPATCSLVGIRTGKLGQFVAAANNALNLPAFFKPLEYAGSAISIDGFGGYRVQHGPDVHAWVYGLNFELSIAFGNDEIKKGL